MNEPKYPVLRYYGGKFRLSPWIISFFPSHKSYVEPFCGSASVLFNKPRSKMETINDLDSAVFNFFRVLRDRKEELIEKIRLTPWSREEYEFVVFNKDEEADEVERARRFYVHITQSVPGAISARKGQWRHSSKSFKSFNMTSHSLDFAVERLQGVQIESREYKRVLEDYDTPETLFYIDPPYITSTRTQSSVYFSEWSNEDHVELAEVLYELEGFVVLSGYNCELYEELFEGWARKDKETQTNGGENRIESVWLSPRTVKTLEQDLSGLPLFSSPQQRSSTRSTTFLSSEHIPYS